MLCISYFLFLLQTPIDIYKYKLIRLNIYKVGDLGNLRNIIKYYIRVRKSWKEFNLKTTFFHKLTFIFMQVHTDPIFSQSRVIRILSICLSQIKKLMMNFWENTSLYLFIYKTNMWVYIEFLCKIIFCIILLNLIRNASCRKIGNKILFLKI